LSSNEVLITGGRVLDEGGANAGLGVAADIRIVDGAIAEVGT